MDKYRISARIINKKGEIVSGNFHFKGLNKLKINDLHLIIYVLYDQLSKNENIYLVNCDIIHVDDSGMEELFLSFSETKVLQDIFYSLMSYCLMNDIPFEVHEYSLDKTRKGLEKYKLEKGFNEDFKLEFKPN